MEKWLLSNTSLKDLLNTIFYIVAPNCRSNLSSNATYNYLVFDFWQKSTTAHQQGMPKSSNISLLQEATCRVKCLEREFNLIPKITVKSDFRVMWTKKTDK